MMFRRPPRLRATVLLQHLVVLAGFAIATLVMTYPVASVLTRAIPIDHQIEGWYPGDGDPWHALWIVWYFKRALATFPPPLLWTDLVFYPIGFDMPFLTGFGVILVPAAALASIVGVTVAYNVVWLLSFVLAGYAMYRLARFLGLHAPIAFVSGALYMFSSYRMLHAREHLPLLIASCLVPFFALALLFRYHPAGYPGQAEM